MTAFDLHLRLLAPLAVASAILLVGCSTPTPTDSSPSGTSGSPQAEGEEQDDEMEPDGPLKPYYNVLYAQGSDEKYRASTRAQQEAVAACMTAAGFQYVPEPESILDLEEELAYGTPESREWVAVNGYGVNSSKEELYAALEAADPNRDYVASLSAPQQEAYNRTLFGDDSQASSSGDEDYGCDGAGQEDVPEPLSLSSTYRPLDEAIGRFYYETVPNDEVVIALNAEWASCMAGKGQPSFASPMAAFESVISDAGGMGAAPAEGGDPAAFEREIALALASFDCRSEMDYEDELRERTHALEAEFVAANKQQLDAMLADAEQRGGD